MKIGVVELDTSHPQNWIPIERELGHEVIGVWDIGTIRPQGFVHEFARDFAIPNVFDSLEAMAQAVDCAIVHSCNWDTHLDKARPFVEAGKAVLIDKPIAGNLKDLAVLRDWVQSGARIAGGSSLRFCYEVRDWLAQPIEERSIPNTVFCGCGTDEFNYGIHAYALLSAIMGEQIQSVQYLDGGMHHRIRVNWENSRMGILTIGTNDIGVPFHATIVTEKSAQQLQVDTSKIYRALLEAVLPYLEEKTDSPPLPFDTWIEPELCAIAARRSQLENNREVFIAELSRDDEGYDGKAFEQKYWKIRNP